MNTAANSNMPARQSLACGLQSTGMMRVATWVENALLRRRTRLQLAELGDDGLKDIGLTRDHVEADLGNYFPLDSDEAGVIAPASHYFSRAPSRMTARLPSGEHQPRYGCRQNAS